MPAYAGMKCWGTYLFLAIVVNLRGTDVAVTVLCTVRVPKFYLLLVVCGICGAKMIGRQDGVLDRS